MREVIVISRCEKNSAKRSSAILDKYFWRIGDKAWRGRASNQCLSRVSKELKSIASRANAIAFHEIKGTERSQKPIIFIGSRRRFSETGRSPVSTAPSKHPTMRAGVKSYRTARSIIQIAIFFHDFGKANGFFQKKIRAAFDPQATDAPKGDPVRHEVFSTFVCDELFGRVEDKDIADFISEISPLDMDKAAENAATKCFKLYEDAYPNSFTSGAGGGSARMKSVSLDLDYLSGEKNNIARAICDLVLTHHRLPGGETANSGYTSMHHLNNIGPVKASDFKVRDGQPFWHENNHLRRLERAAKSIDYKHFVPDLVNYQGRVAMMLADQMGSSDKMVSDIPPDHIANTIRDLDSKVFCADSLSQHVERVAQRGRNTAYSIFNDLHVMPALVKETAPHAIVSPPANAPDTFLWQKESADAAAEMAASSAGGFFACLMAGTGTGKTRGAPTILSAASLNDADPKRRYLRFMLGLGLRTLASQSAKEYVEDLGFSSEDVSVMIGTPPIDFGTVEDESALYGSESTAPITDWFEIENADGEIPEDGSDAETDWIKGLSSDTERAIPEIYSEFLANEKGRNPKIGRLVAPPIICGTIDHLIGVASPVRSQHLAPSLRLLTSDLILDEIDQYGPEDITVLARLAYYVGLCGRRLIIMSATVTHDVAEAMFNSYMAGWKAYADFYECPKDVNVLVAADCSGSVFAKPKCKRIEPLFKKCSEAICKSLLNSNPKRRAEILKIASNWEAVLDGIDQSCHTMHQRHANEIDGFSVSVGFVKLTRVAHTAAVAKQLPGGITGGVLRKKVCLHSRLPRISRAWLEERMRKALRRKETDPHAGIRGLCEAEGLFEEAKAYGKRDIQIVFVTSPVLETGNDVDFDYAILDPLDLRSIVQSAGRVNRHRRTVVEVPNIAILPKYLVAMSDGTFSMPGIETRHVEDTGVLKINLTAFPDLEGLDDPRTVEALMKGVPLDVIDSRLLLDPLFQTPWRSAEADLRSRFLACKRRGYTSILNSTTARLSTNVPSARKFRRSTSKDIELTLSGAKLYNAEWRYDGAAGSRESAPTFSPSLTRETDEENMLFKNLLQRSFEAKFESLDELSPWRMAKYSAIRIIDPRSALETSDPEITIFDAFGALKGPPNSLDQPFGNVPKR